ncbi:MAG: type II secretion system F family protein [Phycisphaerales bacterium]|nr:MAG: type II secretion system F family protein [Phycisphaerales bacterium]
MSMTAIIVLLVWVAIAVALFFVFRRLASGQHARQRLFASQSAPVSDPPKARQPGSTGGSLTRWLYLAGYRDPTAPLAFILITILLAALGLGLAFVLVQSGLIERGSYALGAFPGGVLEIFIPVLIIAPYLVLLLVALLPTVVVRARRRKRVTKIEQDLPITLELLATLTEAGLGFDAALDRLIRSQPADRPLTSEFRTFQAETLSGRTRVVCFRRMARRIDIPSFNVFVSAIVQAEQSGAGIANTLRHQADDLRNIRRERALEFSMSLPVKRLVPMVICFLPGIFVAALGPPFAELIRQVNTQVIGGAGTP